MRCEGRYILKIRDGWPGQRKEWNPIYGPSCGVIHIQSDTVQKEKEKGKKKRVKKTSHSPFRFLLTQVFSYRVSAWLFLASYTLQKAVGASIGPSLFITVA